MKSPQRTRRGSRRGAPPVPSSSVELRAIPGGIRWSRIATAQARIAVDFYQRREVRDRLIEALLAELEG